ncbi:MAG: hypothetical protein NTU83_10055 [Candidatus Hydrogenedentes bacterium]|nr:hypothetical protein [Candidatus Hydrogenedentota bacterium]
MITLRHITTLLLTVGLAACGVKTPVPVRTPPPADASQAKLKEVTPSLDIGDIEASVRVVPVLASQSVGPNVKVDEMKNRQENVLMTTVGVAAPFPAQLQVTFRFECIRAIERVPVAMRVKVFRDKEPIATFALFFDPAWLSTPHEQTLDVLTGLSSVPPTLLIHAEAELVMLPPGTDTAKVDPNTATGPSDMTGVVIGSPMRINFGQEGATP